MSEPSTAGADVQVTLQLAQAHEISPESWLNGPDYDDFRAGHGYAATQTHAIGVLSKVEPEELYWSWWAINRGAERNRSTTYPAASAEPDLADRPARGAGTAGDGQGPYDARDLLYLQLRTFLDESETADVLAALADQRWAPTTAQHAALTAQMPADAADPRPLRQLLESEPGDLQAGQLARDLSRLADVYLARQQPEGV